MSTLHLDLKRLCHHFESDKVVSLHRSWLGHNAPAIRKTVNCPFYFQQAFKIFTCLIPKPFELASPIVTVNAALKRQIMYECA